MKKTNKLIIILLLLMPMVAFGGGKYACGVNQLNIKEDVIENIGSIGGGKYVTSDYKITSKQNGIITAYFEIKEVFFLVRLNTKTEQAIFSTTYDKPRKYHGHNDTSIRKCIKIK